MKMRCEQEDFGWEMVAESLEEKRGVLDENRA